MARELREVPSVGMRCREASRGTASRIGPGIEGAACSLAKGCVVARASIAGGEETRQVACTAPAAGA